jgi:hypothetical protein
MARHYHRRLVVLGISWRNALAKKIFTEKSAKPAKRNPRASEFFRGKVLPPPTKKFGIPTGFPPANGS